MNSSLFVGISLALGSTLDAQISPLYRGQAVSRLLA
jgi:hypothetical protein